MKTQISIPSELPPRHPEDLPATDSQTEALISIGFPPMEVLQLGTQQAAWLLYRYSFNGKRLPVKRRSSLWTRTVVALCLFVLAPVGYLSATHPEKEGFTSFSFSNLIAHVRHWWETRKGPHIPPDPIKVGEPFVLRKPVKVRVSSGIIQLPPGKEVRILRFEGEVIIFRHDFGDAKAVRADLM